MALKNNTWTLNQWYAQDVAGNVSYAAPAGVRFGWGDNESGQLGQNSTTYYSSPVQLPGTIWNDVKATGENSLATRTDGTLWAFGASDYGQLAQNNKTYYSSPKQITGTTWSSISHLSSDDSMAVFKTDSTFWVWGRNQYGNLGQNQAPANCSAYSSPVQIPGTTWSNASFSNEHGAAIRTDGTLWAWGSNYYGRLGQNAPQNSHYSSPVQIPGTTWNRVYASTAQCTFSTRTDGTLWAVGMNNYGQLGQNSSNSPSNSGLSSPVQIPGTTWSTDDDKFDCKYQHVGGVKTDGTLWMWGRNEYGQLGVNNKTNYSSPVQIPGTTWDKIGTGSNEVIASKTDGTLWGWGNNADGQLGQNDKVKYSSPVQIPGSWPNFVSVGGKTVLSGGI